MNAHAFINVVIPFDCTHSGAVNEKIQALTKEGNYPREDICHALAKVRGLHFMTLVVAKPKCPAEYDAAPDLPPLKPTSTTSHLVIEISSDYGPQALFTDLVEHFHGPLLSVLDQAGIKTTRDRLRAYLLRKTVKIRDTWGGPAGQVFSGSPGMTVQRVIDEHALATHLGVEIDKRSRNACWAEKSPHQRIDQLRQLLWTDGERSWKWAFVPDPAPLIGQDPDKTRSVKNPQAWKVVGTVIQRFMWPLYVPFLLLFVITFGYAWGKYNLIVAMMWSLTVTAAFVLLVGLVFFFGLLKLRELEETDYAEERAPSTAHDAQLLAVENVGGQNHLASVSRIKPSWIRTATLRLAFILVGAGRFVSTPGFLGKNGVIHFARWMRLPGTDQLMFWSNYDGTWESYVADFIADAPTGVTGIWSNCVGFPRTHGLVGGGAADRDRTVRWARRQQTPTLFWYGAYRNLSAARIRTNAAIRQGIATAESYQDCVDWLALFGSSPRPASELQISEMPTIVFGGMSDMRYSACWLISLNKEDVEKCRNFVRSMRDLAVYGEAQDHHDVALVLGFAAQGLKSLGIPDDAIETFPPAFNQGMRTPERSRALGDLGKNAPENWRWGGLGREADLLVLIYARDRSSFVGTYRKLARGMRANGHRDVYYQRMTLRQSKDGRSYGGIPQKEPFGFADGVSQPIIRGLPHWTRKNSPNDLVDAGEFVLGYPDNLGVICPLPSIKASFDPNRTLPDIGSDPFRKRPEFASYEGEGRRDIGSNGTYLVVRQYLQHLDAFDAWYRRTGIRGGAPSVAEGTTTRGEASDSEKGEAAAPAAERHQSFVLPACVVRSDNTKKVQEVLFAKLLGRWQDGASLVRHDRPPPTAGDKPPRRPDNDFMMGEDPDGSACPFGSHVRRANPRDTRFPGSKDEIASVNRHRLLRVGRVFGKLNPLNPTEVDPTKEVGLFFMCLNGDIERQFEFVQKTWLLNPSVHGLQDEVDPIVGHGENRGFTIPTPAGPVCLPELPDLTRLIGGGYFFIPGRAFLDLLVSPCAAEKLRD
ncbi:hypothetical protein LJ655_01055 [Paraburkholderia sp. MMS20-SJTN17]|uniref:Dyp-type peroxidase family n=1 Tax=Paraburkholderia translucens TaxID=2886945 RepID=A0ABS8K6Y1_9BURK|nr:hypothetical protein [Paraburkholderia sp. MMS20-SJTN17]MCC8400492.1 hypothetical protein [Paraburkholderia sp. MMS20-SJTN17]